MDLHVPENRSSYPQSSLKDFPSGSTKLGSSYFAFPILVPILQQSIRPAGYGLSMAPTLKARYKRPIPWTKIRAVSSIAHHPVLSGAVPMPLYRYYFFDIAGEVRDIRVIEGRSDPVAIDRAQEFLVSQTQYYAVEIWRAQGFVKGVRRDGTFYDNPPTPIDSPSWR